VVMFTMFFRLNGWMALTMVAAFVLSMVMQISMMFGRDPENATKAYSDSLEPIYAYAVQYVRGIPVVKIFGQTVYSFKRFHEVYMNTEIGRQFLWQS